jgi:hypothetical protein
MLGCQLVISKTDKESQSSPLKFFGEVEMFIAGKKYWRVWEIIIRHEVFPTLPLIPIIFG